MGLAGTHPAQPQVATGETDSIKRPGAAQQVSVEAPVVPGNAEASSDLRSS